MRLGLVNMMSRKVLLNKYNFTLHEKHVIKGGKNQIHHQFTLADSNQKHTAWFGLRNPPEQPSLLAERRDVHHCLSPVSKHLLQAVMKNTAVAE